MPMYYVWVIKRFDIQIGKEQKWCKRIWVGVKKTYASKILQKLVPYLEVKVCPI